MHLYIYTYPRYFHISLTRNGAVQLQLQLSGILRPICRGRKRTLYQRRARREREMPACFVALSGVDGTLLSTAARPIALMQARSGQPKGQTNTMASEVESIVRQIVKTSPPGDDSTVIADIKALLNNADADKLIAGVLREHYTAELTQDGKNGGDAKLVRLSNGQHTIVSKYNQSGMKFFDTCQGIVFDYDFINGRVIDVQQELPSSIDSKSMEKQQQELDDYLSAHYNELSYGLVIPTASEGLTVVIVGEKLNDSNFYNGKWVAVYKWDEQSGKLSGIVKVRVHYYEDGNVVMNTAQQEDLGQAASAGAVLGKIAEYEKDYELNVLKKINVLNEQKFKNLRRLMPISRSKIQWGRAIGNYKLGQDVVGGRQ